MKIMKNSLMNKFWKNPIYFGQNAHFEQPLKKLLILKKFLKNYIFLTKSEKIILNKFWKTIYFGLILRNLPILNTF